MSSIMTFIEGYMSGDAWEELCVSCYRLNNKHKPILPFQQYMAETQELKALHVMESFINVIALNVNMMIKNSMNIKETS